MRIGKAFCGLAFVAFASAASAQGYDLNTPVEAIAADPAAAAVLNKDVPDLLSNENYGMFKVLNLKQLAALSGGRLTKPMLAQTETDLKALPSPAPIQEISY
jgi:hypothetical protein